MSGIIFRSIAREDNPAIAGIIRSVLTEFGANKPGTVFFDPATDHLYQLFQTPGSAYWVAQSETLIAGGAGIFPTPGLPPGCCELVKLYLSKQFRRKGLGEQLIIQCFQTAQQYGYRQMYLETMPELSQAMKLYEKLGFHYLPGPMGQSGHYGCDLWMLKNL